MKPTFFESAAGLRRWLAEHHETDEELWLGMHKVGSGRPSITWPEVVDEALCFGWIDGIRKGIDETSYMNRLTPRRPGSNWSARNIARVHELEAAGRMHPAGRTAFEARTEEKSGVYSYERPRATLEPREETEFRANAPAWGWFTKRAPSYQRTATYWVVSAKKPETRARRLERLIADSAAGRDVAPLARPTPKEKA